MDATGRIELFNILFYISLAVTLVGLGFSIFFFFYYNIPSVWSFMTGAAKRKAIEKMDEQTQKNGRLRGSLTGKTGSNHRHKDVALPSYTSAKPRLEETMRETEVPEQDMETGLLERKPVPPTAAAQPKPVSPKPRPADAHTPKINPGPVAQPARGAVPRHIPATPISQEPISEKEHRTLASEQKPVNRSTIPAETKPSQNEQPTALGNQRSADETTGKTETLSPEMSQEFRFLMTENTLVIHTDEFI